MNTKHERNERGMQIIRYSKEGWSEEVLAELFPGIGVTPIRPDGQQAYISTPMKGIVSPFGISSSRMWWMLSSLVGQHKIVFIVLVYSTVRFEDAI